MRVVEDVCKMVERLGGSRKIMEINGTLIMLICENDVVSCMKDCVVFVCVMLLTRSYL